MDAPLVSKQFREIQDLLEGRGIKAAGFGRGQKLEQQNDALSYLLHIMPRCRGMIVQVNGLSQAVAKLGFMKGVLSIFLSGEQLEISEGDEVEADYQQGFERGVLWAEGKKTIQELREMRRQG